MVIPDLHLPEGATWATVGAIATAGLGWLRARSRNQAYTMGAVDHAVQTALKSVTGRLEVVEGQHKECEANLREVREDLDEVKRDRDARKAEIERLMAGRIAKPGDKAPGD